MAGYDLYLERASGIPILLNEVLAIGASQDFELRVAPDAEEGEAISYYTSGSGYELALFLTNGRILVRGGIVDEDDMRQLIRLARLLDGQLVGSEGEIYARWPRSGVAPDWVPGVV